MLAIIAVHTAWIVGIAAEEWLAGPASIPASVRWTCAVLYVLSEAMRGWCIYTLGARWNVRVVVVEGAERVRGGPYALLRHPNYVAVVVGLVTLPLALGLHYVAGIVLPLKLSALWVRIRREDQALTAAARLTSP